MMNFEGRIQMKAVITVSEKDNDIKIMLRASLVAQW